MSTYPATTGAAMRALGPADDRRRRTALGVDRTRRGYLRRERPQCGWRAKSLSEAGQRGGATVNGAGQGRDLGSGDGRRDALPCRSAGW